MAEKYTGKRKLKKRFLVISSISKFLKKHGLIMVAIILLVIIGIYVYAKLNEPSKVEIAVENTAAAYQSIKNDVASTWRNVSGNVSVFFAGIADGVKNAFNSVTGFFGNLFK